MSIDAQELWRNLKELAVDIGPRAPGTAGEKRAAEYIRSEFDTLGLGTHLEEFPCPGWECEGASLTLAAGSTGFECVPAMYSPGGEVTGELTVVRSDEVDGLSPEDVNRRVILLIRDPGGIVRRNHQALRLESLGAAGLLACTSHAHLPPTKYIREPKLKTMSVVAVPALTACALAAHVGEPVRLEVRARRFETTSSNVVAERPGAGGGVVILTGHYDTAPFIQGAADNASGTAVLLALARSLSKGSFSPTIRFIAVGAEEFGGEDGVSLGGKNYAARHASEMDDILWVLNIDHAGLALADHVVYVMASRELESRAAELLEAHPGVVSVNEMRGGSDHQPFAERGVPAMWLTSSDYVVPVHTVADTIDTLLPAKLEAAARAAEAMALDLLAKPLAPRTTGVCEGNVRSGTEADLTPIKSMLGSIWTMGQGAAMEARHGRIGDKPWQEWVVPTIVRTLRQRLAEGQLLVTEEAGEVVGFITYTIDRERSLGTIGYNGVRRDAGGRGIGARMVEHVLDVFRGEGLRLAEVRTGLNEGHRPARRMYERVGFEPLMESVHYTMEL